MDTCLGPGEMDRLARGELRGGARARAESHVQRCASCRSRIEAHRPAPMVTAPTRRDAPPRPAEHASVDAIEGFLLLDEIHRGGQGVVYRAVDQSRGEIVALKILREGPFATPDQRMRFERESELARTLDHPLIVAPLLSGMAGGRPYHVMKFIEGLTLDAWARETKPSLPRILAAFRDACDAVAHAHARGVVHRDLKPSNIIVDARGKPHVVDFGVAKSSVPGEALPLTVTGEFVGTLSHASPEQAQGDPKLVDERTDVYSLGVILYELLTGRMPYPVTGAPADVLRHVIETEPKSPSALDPTIDEQLSSIVRKAMQKEPDRRYQSAAALRDDVAAYLAGMPVRARPEGALDLLARSARRNKRWFAVAAAFAVVLGLVAALASVQAARFQRQRDRAAAAEAEALARARELEQATALARREANAANVSAASLALRLGRVAEARRRLQQCPEDLRGWEHAHLSLLANAADASVPADGQAVLAAGAAPSGAWTATRRRIDVRDPAGLAVTQSFGIPDVPRPDESAGLEILAVSADAGLLALRWDDATWQRIGAPGRSILVTDREGRVQAILEGAAWRPDRAAFSRDGRRLVATTTESYDASPRAWSTLTGASRRYLSRAGGGRQGATPTAFSPDGALLVEGGGDGRLRAWHAETGADAWTADAQDGRVEAVAWSDDGRRVASAAGDGVHVLSADGATLAVLAMPAGAGTATSVALDASGQRAAAGTDEGSVVAWDVAGGREVLSARGHESAVTALAFAGAGGSLISGAEDGSLQRWSARPGAGPSPVLPLSGARALAFSADGSRVAAAGNGGRIVVFDAATGEAVTELASDDGDVGGLAFSADGHRLAVASRGGDGVPRTLGAWDLTTTPPTGNSLGSLPDPRAIAFTPDGTLLALGGPGVLASWGPDGMRLASFEIPQSPVLLAPAASGAADVAWEDGSVRRIQAATGTEVAADFHGCAGTLGTASVRAAAGLSGPEAGLDRLAFALDQDVVTCAGIDGTASQRVPLRATALAFAPGGARLFAGDARGVLTVLSVEPLEVLVSLDAHRGAVSAVGVSPDGRSVATAGPDGVRLFRSR